MKTGNSLKIIIGVLIVVALMSATAFAATGQPKADPPADGSSTYASL